MNDPNRGANLFDSAGGGDEEMEIYEEDLALSSPASESEEVNSQFHLKLSSWTLTLSNASANLYL